MIIVLICMCSLMTKSTTEDIKVVELIRELPKEHIRLFAKMVDSAYRKRRRVTRESRRKVMREEQIVRDLSSEQDASTNGEHEALISGESTLVTQVSKETSAAVLIQSSIRAEQVKNDASAMQEKNITQEVSMALATRLGFLDIVADLLYNTMFNILDEASCGEFPIEAEPMCFVMKKPIEKKTDKHFVDELDDDEDCDYDEEADEYRFIENDDEFINV
jgi:hypothetical protein